RMQSYREFIEDDDEKKKYDASYRKIIDIIKNKTSYDYNSEVFKHGTLIKLLSDMLTAPNRLSIVTTNYDTVIEDSANSLNYTVFDGFTFSHTPTFDVEMFDWLLAKPIPNIKTQKPEYKKSVINLLKIHGSLTWEKQNDNIVRKDKLAVSLPIMVFPNSNKYMQSYERPYFELFSKFQELLRVPNTVLITSGFSFADNHISKMITQAIKNVPSLSVVITDFNISPEDPNGNWEELVDLMNKGYRISFVKATMNGDLPEYFQGGEFND
ncbi:SIR2 family protein, partial [Aerococcaceae bacterium NML180378]|nr:SIR2 family protein [Aerococcaceae bacterium NML180378]